MTRGVAGGYRLQDLFFENIVVVIVTFTTMVNDDVGLDD